MAKEEHVWMSDIWEEERLAAQTAKPVGAESSAFTTIMEFNVSLLPPEHTEADSFTVKVVWKAPQKYAVQYGPDRYYWLNSEGVWKQFFGPEEEERAAERAELFAAWKEAHLFDMDTALRLANEVAPRLRVGSYTAQDVLDGIGPWSTDE